MDSPLNGPRLKVVRAREHLNALFMQQQRFFDSDPYSITQTLDANTGERVYSIHVLRELPTNRFAALAGDCVHNLRSALDHLVWRLSEDHGGVNEGDTLTQFPIFRTEIGYDGRGVKQIARVGGGAAAVIRSLQPFHDDEPFVHPLWFVRELDNSDKHRSLAITAVAAKNYGHRLHHPKDSEGTFKITLSMDDITDGAEIARVVISPPEAKVRLESTFVFDIALTGPSVPMTLPRLFVVELLDHLCNRVEAAINCFEPFYASGHYDDSVVVDDPIAIFHTEPSMPLGPKERTDEEHQQWANEMQERIQAIASGGWEIAKPKWSEGEVDPLLVIGSDLLSALNKTALDGFTLGLERALDRVEEARLASDPTDLTVPEPEA